MTEDELANRLGKLGWVSVETALEKMKACEPISESGKFIKEKDLFFVEMYAKSTTAGVQCP